MRRALTAAVLAATFMVPATASAHTPSMKNCGAGISAGKNTSCELARSLYREVGRSSERRQPDVSSRSPVTGGYYGFFLYRADRRSMTLRAYGNGILSVRIAR